VTVRLIYLRKPCDTSRYLVVYIAADEHMVQTLLKYYLLVLHEHVGFEGCVNHIHSSCSVESTFVLAVIKVTIP
jgi:hypothetical protein